MSDTAVPAKRTELAWLIVAPIVALAWLLAGQGVLPAPSDAALLTAVRGGFWLSDLVAWTLQPLTAWIPLEVALRIVSAAVLGVFASYLLHRLLYNGWPLSDGVFFVGALAVNAFVFRVIASDHDAIPMMVAFAAVVPGLRRMEAVGDAQAEMSFGLVLPLLFLAGPATALLTLPLALLGALLDPLARKDHRAFVAMFLVALMPTLLVVVGIAAFAGGNEIRSVIGVYVGYLAPNPVSAADALVQARAFAVTIVPFAVVIAGYCFSSDRRRRRLSAVAVIALPAYLLAGALVFSWPISASAATFAFFGALAAWLSVARVHPTLRRIVIALAVLTAIASWAV